MSRSLFQSLFFATEVIDRSAAPRCDSETGDPLSDPAFAARLPPSRQFCDGRAMAKSLCAWLHAHEQAQVMLGSLLVVIGIWWVIRTFISLLINLMCPVVLVLFAVICVPALREPLLGQNYPAVINLLHNIFLRLAENLQDTK